MSLIVYSAAFFLGIAAVLLFRRPRTALRDPLAASTWASIFLGGMCFVCSAPVTLAAVNSFTGIPNFGAPMTYSVISADSASLLILLINWRGGAAERIRRWVWTTIAVYSLLIAAIIVLFALADAPTERLQDLDTYYATTPYMREMIALYLIGHAAGTLVTCAVCLRWSRQVTGLLRTGLRFIIGGMVLDVVGFELAKCTAIVARWKGHDLDFLSTNVAPPAVSLGGLMYSAGFVVPRLLPAALAQWRSFQDYRALAPLWSELSTVPTAPKPSPSRWQLPRGRLYHRELRILDALLALQSRYDGQVRDAAYEEALEQGSSPDEARIVAAAAMVAAAARHIDQSGTRAVSGSSSRSRLQTTYFSDTDELVKMARALASSPMVKAVRAGTVRSTQG